MSKNTTLKVIYPRFTEAIFNVLRDATVEYLETIQNIIAVLNERKE